jgi:phage gp36-like protein
MAYATANDVLGRYPPAKTMVGSSAQDISTADISSLYIFGGEGIVNGYLGAKYTLPIAMPEPLVTQVTADIALYKMCEDKLPRIPDFAEKRYVHAIEILEMLRDGKMVLSSDQEILTAGGDQDAWSATGSYHPTFSPVLGELDQKVDRDFVRAERGERDTDF